MDKIILRDLEIPCIIGIYPQEREIIQSLFLDITIEQNLGPSALSDNIEHTLDYDEVAKTATSLAQEKKYQLIESLAYDLNTLVLEKFPSVQKCTTRVKKPKAVPAAKYAAVEAELSRL